jgi:hypothetical protein
MLNPRQQKDHYCSGLSFLSLAQDVIDGPLPPVSRNQVIIHYLDIAIDRYEGRMTEESLMLQWIHASPPGHRGKCPSQKVRGHFHARTFLQSL